MFQQERMNEIMKILKKNHYVTVDYLVNEIRYSPASIRRDLTILEKQGLVTRSYGGVTVKDDNVSPFRFRQHSMKIAKNAIAKKAVDLIKAGDLVFLDGSSTTQYMGHFLTEKKDVTVVTCNMVLANYLSEQGITTYCTGGKVVEYPGILGGQIMIDNMSRFNVDIAFFSTSAMDSKGNLLSLTESAEGVYRTFREHSKKLAFLCGSDKLNQSGKFITMTLDKVDYFISDGAPSDELKNKFPNVLFLCTK